DRPYTLWIGRSDAHVKRPDHLIELAAACPEQHFLMVMTLEDAAVDRAIRERAPANVTILPRVDFDEIERYFKHATLFVNTSDFEGFPNTFLQAAKYRVPILSLRV